jgi:transposase InsO family protein
LTIRVQAAECLSLEQIRAFLAGSQGVAFRAQNREQVYGFVNQTLRQIQYGKLKRKERGLIRQYLAKMTGFSRAQVTRLITVFEKGEEVKAKRYRRHRFAMRYRGEDIELLSAVDAAHGTLSGPATQKLLQRAYHDFGEKQYQRLAQISVAQLYRLRNSRRYREQRVSYQATRPTAVSIGERRRPDPQGRPGYLRVDTVHQGDQDGVKGVFHINAVDEVTQWQIVGAVAQISEAFLQPLLEKMLAQFPFRIYGFHSDNGSEFINHRVAQLLNKLMIEQTKSRPRHSNDNGLVESKNGAVVRKHMGYTHIAAEHAGAIQSFYEEAFNDYLNFHRPCGVPEVVVDGKGKQRRVYRWYATPWEILRQTPGIASYLREDVTIDELERKARAQTDTEAALAMQKAKEKLLGNLAKRRIA